MNRKSLDRSDTIADNNSSIRQSFGIAFLQRSSGYLTMLKHTGGGPTSWPGYTSENGEVMVLDAVSEVQNDPDREARKALPAV